MMWLKRAHDPAIVTWYLSHGDASKVMGTEEIGASDSWILMLIYLGFAISHPVMQVLADEGSGIPCEPKGTELVPALMGWLQQCVRDFLGFQVPHVVNDNLSCIKQFSVQAIRHPAAFFGHCWPACTVLFCSICG